ncbi:MAG: hypothetical protein U9N19_02750 [Thermodesulfobacteriota bacterium]|nr:hypothetical protein [Thermodesulfobacteriota bacterium]
MNFPGGTLFNWAGKAEVRGQKTEDRRQKTEDKKSADYANSENEKEIATEVKIHESTVCYT